METAVGGLKKCAGIADSPQAEQMFQPDRIHPKAEAHPRMLDNVWPALKPLLR